jgi:hypothetical protein
VTALTEAKEELLTRGDFETAAVLRELERRLHTLLREVQGELRGLELTQPAVDPEASRWEYRVATLEGESLTWPQQLEALRKDGLAAHGRPSQ